MIDRLDRARRLQIASWHRVNVVATALSRRVLALVIDRLDRARRLQITELAPSKCCSHGAPSPCCGIDDRSARQSEAATDRELAPSNVVATALRRRVVALM